MSNDNRELTVDKIVIHYKESKAAPKVIKKGLGLYTTNNDQDAQAEFVGIDDPKMLKALCNALIHSLVLAEQSYNDMQAKEREGKEHKTGRDIQTD